MDGLPRSCRGPRSSSAADRWLHARAAILHQLRPGLVRKLHTGDPQAHRTNKSTLTGEVSGQWSGCKPSRISKSLLLQSGHPDATGKNLQRLVRGRLVTPAWAEPRSRINCDHAPDPHREKGSRKLLVS